MAHLDVSPRRGRTDGIGTIGIAYRMGTPTIERVLILKKVVIFEAIPHEVLVGIASLLTEHWVAAGERIFNKGEHGDSPMSLARAV